VTNKIGVLVAHPREDFFGSPFYSAIMSGVQQETLEAEKALLLHALPQDSPAAIVHELLNEVDGFLFVDLLPHMAAGLEKTLVALPKPVVMVNYEHSWDNVDAVVTDSPGNTRRAMEFLMGLGHTRIAYACAAVDASHPNLVHRLQAYKQTLLSHGLPVDPGLIVIGQDLPAPLLDQLFNQAQPPTAVFCIGSHVAHGWLYPYFAKTGRRVPDDVSVVSYDDVRECELVRPRLTAVGVSLPDLGRLGVKRLLERLAEEKRGVTRHYTISLPGTIIERESHKARK
jgi:DNA-binding LacI/PurR family transcriptional regulator